MVSVYTGAGVQCGPASDERVKGIGTNPGSLEDGGAEPQGSQRLRGNLEGLKDASGDPNGLEEVGGKSVKLEDAGSDPKGHKEAIDKPEGLKEAGGNPQGLEEARSLKGFEDAGDDRGHSLVPTSAKTRPIIL